MGQPHLGSPSPCRRISYGTAAQAQVKDATTTRFDAFGRPGRQELAGPFALPVPYCVEEVPGRPRGRLPAGVVTARDGQDDADGGHRGYCTHESDVPVRVDGNPMIVLCASCRIIAQTGTFRAVLAPGLRSLTPSGCHRAGHRTWAVAASASWSNVRFSSARRSSLKPGEGPRSSMVCSQTAMKCFFHSSTTSGCSGWSEA